MLAKLSKWPVVGPLSPALTNGGWLTLKCHSGWEPVDAIRAEVCWCLAIFTSKVLVIFAFLFTPH